MYYQFLCRTAASACRHVVIVAGNHDSPSFLNAPRELLRELNIHVVGNAYADPADEIIMLRDSVGNPELIVCAVPYLRDRDIRSSEPGESFQDRDRKMQQGIMDHYARVMESAEKIRNEHGTDIPVAVMGHLFTKGGRTVDGDGVRELYVGSLAHVPTDVFSESADYTALGHLHVPQTVGGNKTVRYSGSPIAMGFRESTHKKSICVAEFTSRNGVTSSAQTAESNDAASGSDNHSGQCGTSIRLVEIPVFQTLIRIEGTMETITGQLSKLAESGQNVWVEIEYTGDAAIGSLRETLEEMTAGTQIEILRIKNLSSSRSALNPVQPGETLDELTPEDVFVRCMDNTNVPEETRSDLIRAYREILQSLHETDSHAE
jgi:DNA repair protein SbcD/Mre11